MSEKNIQESLQGLREELGRLRDNDRQIRERVNGLIAEVEQELLEDKPQRNNPSLIEGINNTIEQYKVEHPGVTSILNQIMMSLSNIGV